MIPKHVRPTETDSPSIAHCDCAGVIFCPRHHAHAYARYKATHRGESVEVAA